MGMRCPHCQADNDSHVIDSRDCTGKQARRRRHLCNECKGRFTTYEIPAAQYEKMLSVDVAEIDSVITTLQSIKVQFGSNGHGQN